jgi:hypothetical protein
MMAPIAALVLVLTLASIAQAECAWVLWGQQMGRMISGEADKSGLTPLIQLPRTDWTRYSAYATQDGCWAKITSLTFVAREGSLTDTLGRLFGNDRTGQRITNGAASADGQFEYVCVPETWNPRGPTGK